MNRHGYDDPQYGCVFPGPQLGCGKALPGDILPGGQEVRNRGGVFNCGKFAHLCSSKTVA